MSDESAILTPDELRSLAHKGLISAAFGPNFGRQINATADWIDQALEVLREVEWRGSGGWPTCPLCGSSKRSRTDHKPDCKLAALIGAKVAE